LNSLSGKEILNDTLQSIKSKDFYSELLDASTPLNSTVLIWFNSQINDASIVLSEHVKLVDILVNTLLKRHSWSNKNGALAQTIKNLLEDMQTLFFKKIGGVEEEEEEKEKEVITISSSPSPSS